MDDQQQGLYLMTVILSLVSLFSNCFFLIVCHLTKMWKFSSVRLLSYLTASNMINGFILILPTYKYDFLCSFQGHVLNFSIVSQIIWCTLLLHFAYYKIVQEKKFSRIIEIRYIGIALLPALLTSLPPFISENVGNNCWSGGRSPLQVTVSSFGFLVLSLVTLLINVSFLLSISVNLALFPKGYNPEEYFEKSTKFKFVSQIPIIYYFSFCVVFIYAVLEIINRQQRPFDFLAMFCHCICGFAITLAFMLSDKVKKNIRNHFSTKISTQDIMQEDIDRLSSIHSSSILSD